MAPKINGRGQPTPKKGSRQLFWSKRHQKRIQHHQITQNANFQPNRTKLSNDPKNPWAGSADAQKGVTTTFFGQNNIKNEFRAIKLVRVQIFSQIGQL